MRVDGIGEAVREGDTIAENDLMGSASGHPSCCSVKH